MRSPRLWPLVVTLTLLLHPRLHAEETAPYQRPSPALAALVDAPLPPAALLAPGRTMLLLMDRREMPAIAELAQPELRQRYGQAGRQWVERHFSIQAMVQGNLGVYRGLLQRLGRSA